MGCTVTFHDRIGHDRTRRRRSSRSAPMPPSASSSRPSARRCAPRSGPLDAEVELTLAGDPEMERLNFDHMGERGPTDVLSFPLHEWSLNGTRSSHLADDDGDAPPGPILLGDVVIDLDQALRQAAEGDWGVVEELVLLAIHGTLHLRRPRPRRASRRKSACAASSTRCSASSIDATARSPGSPGRSSTARATRSRPEADPSANPEPGATPGAGFHGRVMPS